MQVTQAIITLSIIFTTLYSFGLVACQLLYKDKKFDIFFQFLVGYIFIGSMTVIFHFFFKINNFYSLSIILLSLFLFSTKLSKINKLGYLKLILIFLFSAFLLLAYSDHPIDTNMYHHPYVAYLKSEKRNIKINFK